MVLGSEAIGPGASNSKAIRIMGELLGSDTLGATAGSISYAGATGLVYDILFRGRTEQIADLLKREILECVVPQGITTYGNHYYGSANMMKVHNLLYQRGELPIRWAWWLGGSRGRVGGNSDPEIEAYYDTLGDFRGIGNDYIWNAGIGNEGWEGGMICTDAEALDPNSPKVPRGQGDLRQGLRPSCSDPFDYSQEGGYRNVLAALKSGLRIGFLHHYSDGTFDALFRVIEQAMAEGRAYLGRGAGVAN